MLTKYVWLSLTSLLIGVGTWSDCVNAQQSSKQILSWLEGGAIVVVAGWHRFLGFDGSMSYKLHTPFFVGAVIAFCSMVCQPSALAQYVSQTAFCENVSKLKCGAPIPHGATIKKRNRVFFWATITSTEEVPVTVYMVREGICYDEEVRIPEDNLNEKVDLVKNWLEWARTLKVGDIGQALGFGLKEGIDVGAGAEVTAPLGLAKVSATVRLVIVPKGSVKFRVYDFRDLSCAGTLRARIIDSNGHPLAGANETKMLYLSEEGKR